MAEGVDLSGLWRQTVERLFATDLSRTVLDACKRAVPLTIEDDVLILGMLPENMQFASYIETRANKSVVQGVLQAISGRRLDLRVIEGDSIEAYERTKARDQSRADLAAIEASRRGVVRAEVRTWEALHERLMVMYQELELRRFPQITAKYLVRSFPLIADVDEAVRAAEPDKLEAHERALSRVFEKLRGYTDIPTTVIALEYLRYRSTRRKGGG